jgi:cytochrome P450
MLEHCSARYGSRFTLRATGFPPLVFLSDVDEIKAMLLASSEALHPGEGGEMIRPIVGAGSFMLHDEDQHRDERKAVLPAFHKRAVQEHAGLVTRTVREEVASWPQYYPVALYPYLRAMTLKLVLRITFGSSGSVTDAQLDTLRDHLLRMLSVTASPVFPEPLLRHGAGRAIWNRFLHDRAEVDALIHTLVDERDGSEQHSPDVLTELLRMCNLDGSQMSRQQVRDHIMSIILAGHETTASQLAWAFQLLAHNPTVQATLTAEVDRGDSDDYLTATIQEVMRHRPVFLFTIPRAVVKPVEIGEWTYRPPAQLLGCTYLLHHDPSIYTEPNRFRPERFLDAPPPPHLWLPWGGGRRRCPGLHLAMLEMKTVLRTVLSTTTVLPAAKHMERPRWRSVIVTPHAGARVMLRPRRQSTARLNTKAAEDGSRCVSAASIERQLPGRCAEKQNRRN